MNINNFNDKYQILKYIDSTGKVDVYDKLNNNLQNDSDILLACVENDIRFVKKLPMQFKADNDFLIKCIFCNPLFLSYIKKEMPDFYNACQGNRQNQLWSDICHASLQFDGDNYHYLSKRYFENSFYLNYAIQHSSILGRQFLYEKFKNKYIKQEITNAETRSDIWLNEKEKFLKSENKVLPLKYPPLEKTASPVIFNNNNSNEPLTKPVSYTKQILSKMTATF